MAGVGRFHAWRQAATAAAALALVVLVLVAATREPGPAAAAQAKGKEGKAPAAAKPSIKGLQGEVDKVMVAERRAGQLVRKAMMEKDQDEVQLESAEDGLQASAESPDTSATSLKSSHTSIQQIKDQIAAATKRAEKAKATRAKLQKELDKELNQLAHQQFIAHKAAAAKSGGPAAAMAAAAVSAVGTVTGKGGSSLATAVKEQETVLAGMDQQLLKLPKVRKALQQSLNEKELKIASGTLRCSACARVFCRVLELEQLVKYVPASAPA